METGMTSDFEQEKPFANLAKNDTLPCMEITPKTTMRELLKLCPGAQRALFRHYHIGGCASCGFQPEETIEGVCARNENLDPADVISRILDAHAQDQKVLIAPAEAAEAIKNLGARLLDIRTREEFDAVHIPGSQLMGQDFLQEIMGRWPKDMMIVIVDHTGTRNLDAAAYFSGHGFTNARALRGGIDAWSCEVDPSLPRYTTE
jgi:rhodanese-related sulfurtransferase